MAFLRRSFLVPLSIWLLLPVARADDNARDERNEPVYEVSPGVTAPRVIHRVRPERRQSGKFHLSGKVVISLVVSSAGLPTNIKILEGMDAAVDESVVIAVKQWRFAPGKKDGKPVAVRTTVEVSFTDL